MRKSRKESEPRQNKVRLFANGQYEERCSATTRVLKKASRRSLNHPEDSKKIEDQNRDKQRAFKEALKNR